MKMYKLLVANAKRGIEKRNFISGTNEKLLEMAKNRIYIKNKISFIARRGGMELF